MKSFDTRFSNKSGSKKAKELIMKVVYSVIHSVDSSARSENARDITKKFQIKKAANQRLAAIVGKTERTVERHAAGIQYVNIIGLLGSPYYSHAPILTKNFIAACPSNRD
jgi:signal recognition particle GTPase